MAFPRLYRWWMQFGLLGPLEVRNDDRAVEISGVLPRRLLAILLVHARTVVSADRLVDALWRDQPPPDPRLSLWMCVARLRRALAGPADGPRRTWVITRTPGYLLAVEPDQIDASRFERLVIDASHVAADRPRAAADVLDEALALWRGPALQEFADEPFAAAESARLDELRLAATESRFELELELRAEPALIADLRGFTDAHPLRERPRAQLMLALYRCGRHAEAVECYRSFRQLMQSELGLEPSDALRRLQTQILRRAPELDRAPPAADFVTGSRGVPLELTRFFGRAPDLAAAARALAEERLVTFTGMGGVGKTRLAEKAAAAVAAQFADGVSWCELAPITDPAAVAPAVATCLGVRRSAESSVVESVVHFLADHQRLLVLDNCEHVLPGLRSLVDALLRGCPRIVILATSRTRLAIAGEHVRFVAPLPLPDSNPAPDVSNPAISLFIDRARAVRPDLVLGEENLTHIAAICRQLDGLPLALEITAARVRSLNPADISARIRSGLDVLAPVDNADRHGTLRAVLDWSYGLLAPDQRRLFDRLSVFAGTFDPAAVEAVCSGPSVLDLLTSLVDASMVSPGATEGPIRYFLLDTVRQYAAGHLDSGGDAETVRLAYARHYASVAVQADRGLRGPDEARWVSVVDRELDNFRAAHRWMTIRGRTDLALRLSGGLRYYMLFRFRDEVVGWGESSLELPGAQEDPQYALVCGAVGEGVTVRGDMQRARALADRALRRLSDPDDVRRIYPLRVSGMVSLYVGRLEDALHQHTEMLRLARLHDHRYETGMALLGLAQSRTYAGDAARGLAFAREQLDVVRSLGNPSMLALAWYDQAEALAVTDPSGAIEPYRRAIGLARSAGSTFVEGIALVGLASHLGRSADPSVAFPLFNQIVGRWRRMGVWHHQWTTLRNLLQLLLRTGRWETAAILLGAIEAGSTTAPAFGQDADLLRSAGTRLADTLGASAWSAARSRGATMSREEAVAFACAAIDEAIGEPASGNSERRQLQMPGIA